MPRQEGECLSGDSTVAGMEPFDGVYPEHSVSEVEGLRTGSVESGRIWGKVFSGFHSGYETFSGKDCFTSFAMTVPYFQGGSVLPVNY